MKSASFLKKTIAWALVAPVIAISSAAMAGTWDKCAGCHNGKTAQDNQTKRSLPDFY